MIFDLVMALAVALLAIWLWVLEKRLTILAETLFRTRMKQQTGRVMRSAYRRR